MRFKRNGPLDFEASKQLFNFAAQIFAAVLVLGLVELLRILIHPPTLHRNRSLYIDIYISYEVF